MAGLLLRARFPEGHLGLLVASAKSSFDSQRNCVAQLAANIVVLDRSLAHYGAETQATRAAYRKTVDDMIGRSRSIPAEFTFVAKAIPSSHDATFCR